MPAWWSIRPPCGCLDSPHHGITLDARMVVDQAAVRLPRFARPRFVKVVAQLPKTATGKVQRAALRKQGAEGAIDLSASG